MDLSWAWAEITTFSTDSSSNCDFLGVNQARLMNSNGCWVGGSGMVKSKRLWRHWFHVAWE